MVKGVIINKSLVTLGLIAGAIIAVATISGTANAARPAWGNAQKPGTETIVQIVLKDDKEFDVLQAAVVKAELVDTLNGTKQYTVFAPTDAAFVKYLGTNTEAEAIATVNSLDKNTLTDILLFHVTEGRRGALSVLASPRYQMVNGDKLSRYQLLKAGIAKVNVSASNGVIHVINNVLVPPAHQ